uniref:Calcineurin-like phosphoesterase domain-containing protein n=1 Tax=viral metagenome TaxID=1070528 RepID=A0A6C0D560_9ZZZZ
MSYKLQYASNFFLNLHKRRDFNKMLIPSSENLALLGNICSCDTKESLKTYKQFLDYCSLNYKNVYIVPGPWEHCSAMPQLYHNCIDNLYNLKKEYKNVTILNNSHSSIPKTDITLLGSTLWCRYPYLKHQCMFEFNYIWLKRHSSLGQIMGHDILNWHMEDLQYIKDMKQSSQKIIMLTHHLPHPVLSHDTERKRMETNNLEKHMKKPIEIWLGGAGDNSVTGTLGICNDVFCGVNPYTTFSLAKNSFSEKYRPQAYVSLRTSDIELV